MEPPRFSELLDALGAERLRAHMAERRPLHVPAPAGLGAQSLLSLDAFEAAIARGRIARNEVKLFKGYNKLDLSALGAIEGDWLAPFPLAQLLRDETTLVVNGVERLVPHLWEFAADAERMLGDRTTLATVLSNGSATGISPHHDPYSLILVQLEGSKRWRFYDAVAGSGRVARPGEFDAGVAPSAELTLETGDLLFVPQGLRHWCAPGGHSFHLGILVQHQLGTVLAAGLERIAAADEVLAEPLVRFAGEAGMRETAEAYRARLHAILDEIDVLELFDRKLARRPAVERIPLRAAEPDAPGATAMLTTAIAPVAQPGGRIGAAGATVEAAPAARAVVDALRSGPVEVAALHARIGDDVEAALAALIAKGLVRIAAPPRN